MTETSNANDTDQGASSSSFGSNRRDRNNSDNNKNKNSNKNNKNNNKNKLPKFKGQNTTLATLGLTTDTYKTDSFIAFQSSIKQEVLTNFDNGGDIAIVVRDLEDPLPRLMK